MEMHERIKLLRKNYLKMSQEVFGKKLGVSRSVIKNIELNALARPEHKLSLIKLMSKEFNVNEEWLLHGNEPMYAQPQLFSLDQFVKERGMTDNDLKIVKAYFELEPDVRKAVIEFFRSATKKEPTTTASLYDEVPKTPEELEDEYPPNSSTDVAGIG